MPLVLNGATSGSTTIQATDAVTATLTLPNATGTLISTASSGQVIPSGALPAGTVLQVVTGTLSSQFSTTSTTYVSTGLSTSITPKFSTSKILVVLSSNAYVVANGQCSTTIYRNGSNIGNSSGFNSVYSTAATQAAVNITYLDSPASTSSQAYTVYIGNANGSQALTFNAGTYANNSIATLTLMEIAA